ncbi:MAG: CoA transferase [Thermomicrobium sp.]|nr:CoA transferase [Thermomicrobium sp.]
MNTEPLSGIRVLEFGGYIAAPYATSILCSLGAEVVKVEKPNGGDEFRRGSDKHHNPYFIQYNAGKRSLAVDLKTAEGVELVKALIPRFDVLVENLRPGKLVALGLGPADCARLRPDLVYASCTGFGDGGPLKLRPAFDTIGQALGGVYSVLSDAGDVRLSGAPLADLISGVVTAMGVLSALVGRQRFSSGMHVTTSLMEAVSTLTIDAITLYFENGETTNPHRQSRHPQAQNFCVQTSSGEYIAIHLSSSEKFWLALVSAIDRQDLANDARFATYSLRVANYFALVDIIRDEFLKRSLADWEDRLSQADVPFARVLGVREYLNHPQMQWLGLLEPRRDGVSLVRAPWRFNGRRPARTGAAPLLGSDTRLIATEVFDAARVDSLIAAGVLTEPDFGRSTAS